MPILKIKPHMIEPIPGEKIPELYEARDGYPNLNNRLENVDAKTVNGYVPVNKEGDDIAGSITIAGNLSVKGDVELDSRISKFCQVETKGNFGVNTTLSNCCDVCTSLEEDIMLSYVPLEDGNYLIYIYFRITSDNNNIFIKVGYEDYNGYTYQSMIDGEAYDSGSYCLPALFVNAKLGSPIVVKANSSIEDSLFISSSIVGL